MARIGVIGGAGYVGLVTGVGLAALGHKVVSMDLDSTRLGLLKSGKSAVYEDGLEPLLAQLIQDDWISFTESQSNAVEGSGAIFIAVGTPSLDSGAADLSAVIAVAEQLRTQISSYKVIVVKSTVPVGTLDVITDILSRDLQEGIDFDVVSNPEFLREGSGLIDFFAPSRVIVGTKSEKARAVLRDIYQPLLDQSTVVETGFVDSVRDIPYIETDAVSAQLTKYAANAYLATRISYINEIAGLSEKMGGSIRDIIEGLSLDPRIGSGYLQPGIGFGGPCLDKDLRALITVASENSYEPVLFNGVLQRNEMQLREVMNKITDAIGPSLYQKRIALLGIAFKEGTNDVRHSLSIRLFRMLRDQGATVIGHDVLASDEVADLEPDLELHEVVSDALAGSDAAVVLNAEPMYRGLSPDDLDSTTYLLDTRGTIDVEKFLAAGKYVETFGSKNI